MALIRVLLVDSGCGGRSGFFVSELPEITTIFPGMFAVTPVVVSPNPLAALMQVEGVAFFASVVVVIVFGLLSFALVAAGFVKVNAQTYAFVLWVSLGLVALLVAVVEVRLVAAGWGAVPAAPAGLVLVVPEAGAGIRELCVRDGGGQIIFLPRSLLASLPAACETGYTYCSGRRWQLF